MRQYDREIKKMRRILLIISLVCICGMWPFLRTANNDTQVRDYQYYFQWCSEKLAARNIDANFTDKTCDCIATKIVDSYPDAKELSPDELKPIIFLCLLDRPQRAAYDEL